jgi:DNA-binding transcriptional ArsR family regulator
MASHSLTPELLELIGERFRALAEPARLNILNTLRDAELSVSELIERTELGQANLSKHLQLLYRLGFVDRRKDGLYVYYRLADEDIFRLCDIMCGRLEREAGLRSRILSPV